MKLHNTMSRQLETLQPLSDNTVKLYTCGLTVYSQPHIGNWLGYIYWDVLVRTLQHEGYTVIRTQNVTDVGHLVSDDDSGEDKMEKGAKSEGVTAWDIAAKYSAIAEHEGYDLLGLIRPDHLVPATSCIEAQIEFAQILDDKGYLYRTDDGMYFDSTKLDDYGKLARLDTTGLDAGSRVDMAGKKNPTDFAVWKFSPSDSKRDMEWKSPWGMGFPGWHLECSVIARQTLGDQIDIHTGGIDHIPVHHTNEIAQTEAVTGKRFTSIWVHNNHIKFDGRKISKSLGNTHTLDDIVSRGYDLGAFKLLALSKHYRTEGNFTWEILGAQANRLASWKNIAALRHQVHDTLQGEAGRLSDDRNLPLYAAKQAIAEALSEDIDTPKALAIIDEVFGRLGATGLDRIHRHSLVELLETIDDLLGLHLLNSTPDISDDAKQLIITRERVREAGDWTESDKLRDELKSHGVTVRDTAHGTIWSYA